MKFLTENQKHFILYRTIKVNGLYMFPAFGFTAYQLPDYDKGIDIDTNPFTKSLGQESFIAKEITPNGFVRGNFYRKPVNPDFYLLKHELESRGLIEMGLYYIVLLVPFCIYNLFRKEKP